MLEHKIILDGYRMIPAEIEAGTSGSYGNECMSFQLGNEWTGLSIKISFYPQRSKAVYKVLSDGDTVCDIPQEATAKPGICPFMVVGYEDGRVIKSVTGTIKVISVPSEANAAADVPTPSQVEQIYTYMQTAIATANSVVERANAGEFNGDQGEPGNAATISVGSVITGESGDSASVTNSGSSSNAVFNFVIPRGNDGANFKLLGHYSTLEALEAEVRDPDVGAAYSVGESVPYDVYIFDGVTLSWVNHGQIIGASAGFGTPAASAVTLPSGSEATAAVAASGEDTEKVFAFTFGIPKGADGKDGENGKDGADGLNGKDGADGLSAGFGTPTAAVNTLEAGEPASVTVTASGDDTSKVFAFNFGIPKGADGKDGLDGKDGTNGKDGTSAGFGTPVASAQTLDAGAAASVAVAASGTDTAKIFAFNFGIPRGADGKDGTNGKDGTSAGFGTPSASAATLPAGSSATASVSASGGDTSKVFSFSFGIPRGADGKDGKDGKDGTNGSDFSIKGYYSSLTALESAVTSPSPGDAYGIGTEAPFNIYIWDGVNGVWVNNGSIQGAKGDTGASAGFGTPTASVSSLPAGSDATVTVEASGEDTSKVFAFTFGIPRGADGTNGKDGENGKDGTAGLSAGFGTPTVSVNTLGAGENATASVSASGADTSKVFAFTFGIPRGADGNDGANGANGKDGAAAGFGTPTVSVNTLAAGSAATASVSASGADTAKVFSFVFGIPRGADGSPGPNELTSETATSFSGLLKGNGSGIETAVSGVDYQAPLTFDSSPTSGSANPVTSDGIYTALAGKSDTDHTHSEYVPLAGGTMTGVLTAQNNTSYTTYQVRNIALSTTASTPTNTGDILGVYS